MVGRGNPCAALRAGSFTNGFWRRRRLASTSNYSPQAARSTCTRPRCPLIKRNSCTTILESPVNTLASSTSSSSGRHQVDFDQISKVQYGSLNAHHFLYFLANTQSSTRARPAAARAPPTQRYPVVPVVLYTKNMYFYWPRDRKSTLWETFSNLQVKLFLRTKISIFIDREVTQRKSCGQLKWRNDFLREHPFSSTDRSHSDNRAVSEKV